MSVIFALVAIPAGLYYLAKYSLFGGGGPSPKLVLVVPSNEYEVKSVLDAIDKIDSTLGPRENRKDASEGDRFFYYKHAYWYPSSGSDTYGIALIEWNTTTWENDKQQMGGSYFIDVYSEKKECSLCDQLKVALSQSQVKFKSPCETQTNLTEYERIRCDI
ncbi:hypothetical protein DN730_05315 [Marinomonas piezotolerans]|uniref:Uncharacterized protein n=2 Tax=Marinomonas piezotolerans TaxID=2213058 RepID=A0A370UBA5_9GAMM|nr:hypothetical protein DN730_05315 [Marinomonas piezotolerans]